MVKCEKIKPTDFLRVKYKFLLVIGLGLGLIKNIIEFFHLFIFYIFESLPPNLDLF